MRTTGHGRPVAREPFPWFILALIALAALALVAISAVRIYRFRTADSAHEQRWRAQHDALMREAAEQARVADQSE